MKSQDNPLKRHPLLMNDLLDGYLSLLSLHSLPPKIQYVPHAMFREQANAFAGLSEPSVIQYARPGPSKNQSVSHGRPEHLSHVQERAREETCTRM